MKALGPQHNGAVVDVVLEHGKAKTKAQGGDIVDGDVVGGKKADHGGGNPVKELVDMAAPVFVGDGVWGGVEHVFAELSGLVTQGDIQGAHVAAANVDCKKTACFTTIELRRRRWGVEMCVFCARCIEHACLHTRWVESPPWMGA